MIITIINHTWLYNVIYIYYYIYIWDYTFANLSPKTFPSQLGPPDVRREVPRELHHGLAQLALETLLPVLAWRLARWKGRKRHGMWDSNGNFNGNIVEFMELQCDLQWELHGIYVEVNGNFMELLQKSMGTSWNLWNFNGNLMKLVYESQWELHGIYGTSMTTS